MQQEIRNASVETFPELERFVDMKSKGHLLDPGFVAAQILSILDMPDFGRETTLHINDFI
jgi:hypothetical protein